MTEPLTGFPDKVPIGISQCLLGASVRYDGSHKRSRLCTEALANHFEFVPVCPEMGIGMGAPREPIHLVGTQQDDTVRAVGNHTPGLDVTAQLEAYGRDKSARLGELCGYIFMERSPSCGLSGVKVHDLHGKLLRRRASGIYAREFTARHPLLPVEEDARLHDPQRCENFLTRVYAWQRWRALEAEGLSHAKLRDFHSRHKYLLSAHRPAAYGYLCRLLARAGQRRVEDAAQVYIRSFMATLQIMATRHGHAEVLRQLAGYFRKQLNPHDRQALAQRIEDYRRDLVPLAALRTLLRRHLRQHPNDYLQRQTYLEPYPPELAGVVQNLLPTLTK